MNTTTLKGRKVLYVNRANVNDRVYVRENFKPLPETVPLTLDTAPGNNDSPLDDLIYAVQFALDRVARRVKSFIGIE